jgi:hypothetical protein
MTNTTLNPVQQKFVDDFAVDPDVVALVAGIEARPATTRNHYGDYGAALSTMSGGRKIVAQLLGLAFVKAGANAQGVSDALTHLL